MAESLNYDFVVVGSGGGGFAAALAATAAGASTLIIEKGDKVGGSTAMSGGVLWMPYSLPAERSGAPDSLKDGMRYFDSLVGDAGPASSIARRTAFIQEGRELLKFLEGEGLTFVFCDGYADYYDELPGGKPRGRVLKAPMLPSGQLGEWFPRLRQFDGWKVPINTDEFSAMTLVKRTWRGRITALKVALRMMRERLTGQQLLCRGAAVQGRMLMCVVRRKIPIWSDSPVVDLMLENGRVSGVVVQRAGSERLEVRAKSGVLLNGGGFARNAEMRKRYHPQPSLPAWSASNPGDTGELIEKAIGLGAATDMLDEAIWVPASVMPDGTLGGFHNPHDLAKPFCIMVTPQGRRFVNEAASYMEVGQAMYRNNAVPAWAILDSRHRGYYSWGFAPPSITPPAWIESGYMRKADSIAELAAKCNIDAAGLAEALARFNGFAREGVDQEFKRGVRAYDRYYGDSSHGPNASLGPIDRPPFYAVQIYPGDVGTFGGLMTDEYGAVLRADGSQIDGLYATGNCTASVMGRTYPGAGASIAASFVFGYTAAKHAVGAAKRPTQARVAGIPDKALVEPK